MRAREVLSPISRTRNHVVVFESPTAWDEQWSLVEAEVTDDGEYWDKRLGIRWDGDRRDSNSKGFPSSSGHGVWFWLPTDVVPFFYAYVIPQLKQRKKSEKGHRALMRKMEEILESVSGSEE